MLDLVRFSHHTCRRAPLPDVLVLYAGLSPGLVGVIANVLARVAALGLGLVVAKVLVVDVLLVATLVLMEAALPLVRMEDPLAGASVWYLVLPPVPTPCTILSSPAPPPCTLSSRPAPLPCVFVSELEMFRVPLTGSTGFTFSPSLFLAWKMLFC